MKANNKVSLVTDIFDIIAEVYFEYNLLTMFSRIRSP